MADRSRAPDDIEDDGQLPACGHLAAFHPLSPDPSWFEEYWAVPRQKRCRPAVRIFAAIGICAALAAGGSVVARNHGPAPIPLAAGASLPNTG